MSRVRFPGYAVTAGLQGFDGGLNLRDAPTEVASNESPYMMNITLDERGGATSRLGLSKLNGSSLLPSTPQYSDYSAVADAVLAFIPSDGGVGKLYKSTDGGATWSVFYSSFTAGGKAAFCDFHDRVVVCHTIDGTYSFPSSLAAPTLCSAAVKGSTIAAWKNKIWVAGDPNDKTVLKWSNIGNELVFTGADLNRFRDGNDDIITCIGGGQGTDLQNYPTLLVCKNYGMYRVNDATTGAYTTLHLDAGAAGSKCIASNLGEVVTVNDRGVWATPGVSMPNLVSAKIAPFFTPASLNMSLLDGAVVAPYRNRFLISLPRSGAAANDLTLEYHPLLGWFTAHSFAIASAAVYTKQTNMTLGFSTSGGKVYELFKGGSDDGTSITAYFQTKWVPLSGSFESRFRKMRAFGRGTIDMYVKCDFTTEQGTYYQLPMTPPSGSTWDLTGWDSAGSVWGDVLYEYEATIAMDDVARYASFLFQATTSTSSFAPPMLGTGAAQEIGAWAMYGISYDSIPLGT